MKKIIVILLLLSTFIYANGIKIAVGLSIPPYVIKHNDSGFELDLIKLLFEKSGYKIDSIVYASNKRITKLLSSKSIDVALNVQPNIENVHYSKAIINFENVAITLKNKHEIKSLKDLENKKVYAFQNAHKFLGKEFYEFTKEAKYYEETIHQIAHVKRLILGDVDVVISDKYIFNYFYNNRDFKKGIEFDYYNILPKSPRFLGFLDEKMRDDFNKVLEECKDKEEYLNLFKKYNIKGE